MGRDRRHTDSDRGGPRRARWRDHPFHVPLLGAAVDRVGHRRRAVRPDRRATTIRGRAITWACLDGPDESVAAEPSAPARAPAATRSSRPRTSLVAAAEASAIRRRTGSPRRIRPATVRERRPYSRASASLDAGPSGEILALGSIAQTEDIDRSVQLLQAAAAEAGDDIALRARILSALPFRLRWDRDRRGRADRP